MKRILIKNFCQMNKSLPSKMRHIAVYNSNRKPELYITEGNLPVTILFPAINNRQLIPKKKH